MRNPVVITDANILIDLLKLKLTDIIFVYGSLEFKTTDFILNELYRSQQEELQIIIEEGYLEGLSSNESDIHHIFVIKQKVSGLSFEDCFAFYYCQKLHATLLTGERRLRNYAQQHQINVHGILFLFDLMVKEKLINPTVAVQKLYELLKQNNRLPINEVVKRIEEWSGI